MALNDFFYNIELIREQVEVDVYGTHTETYTKILEFSGAVTTAASSYKLRGEKPDTNNNLILTTTKDVPLKFNDIIYDTNRDKHFQIISDQVATPKSAALNIQQFTLRVLKINI